jgi:hypothetical protein
MVTRLLQVQAHVILCFRAEPKVEAIREGGQTKIIPKPSLTGLDGWIPISEKMLPYELTASFLLMADKPGVPKPIKLQEQHKPFVPLDRMLSEETGRLLAEWARGGEGAAADAAHAEEASAALISESERAGLDALRQTQGIPVVEAKRILMEKGGVDSSKLLRRDLYDAVVAALEEWQPPESQFAIPEGARAEA